MSQARIRLQLSFRSLAAVLAPKDADDSYVEAVVAAAVWEAPPGGCGGAP